MIRIMGYQVEFGQETKSEQWQLLDNCELDKLASTVARSTRTLLLAVINYQEMAEN